MVQLANYRISFTSFPPHRNSNNCKLCNYLEHCKLSERYEITGNNIIGGNYIAKFLEELQLGEGGGGGEERTVSCLESNLGRREHLNLFSILY